MERFYGIAPDSIESRGEDYFRRVREEYLGIAEENPDRVIIVDGMQTIDDIFKKDIPLTVNKMLKLG